MSQDEPLSKNHGHDNPVTNPDDNTLHLFAPAKRGHGTENRVTCIQTSRMHRKCLPGPPAADRAVLRAPSRGRDIGSIRNTGVSSVHP